MDDPVLNAYFNILDFAIDVQCWLMLAQGGMVYRVVDGLAWLFPRYAVGLLDWFNGWVQRQIDWVEKRTA